MIAPYRIQVSDERLAAIRARVEGFDWEQLPDAGGWTSGVGLADLRRLSDYWLQHYDWRAVERRLNLLPQFTTDISGQRIHFVHRRGDGTKPPLLLLHGWPGSFLEFEDLLDPLVADGHDVVVPSLPGFAFSRPVGHPVGPREAAVLMHGLMAALYDADTGYVVQGGDWGAGIGGWMGWEHPESLLGLHLNMVNVSAHDARPTTDEELQWADDRREVLDRETGYSHQQGTRPQTLGVAMADSPLGTAAWILEKFGNWSDSPRDGGGAPDVWRRFSEELLITNIMLYVATGSTVTSTWIYQGQRTEGSSLFPPGTTVRVPTGIAAFPDPVFAPPPRSLAARSYHVVHWTDMPAGGHFAALEEPEAFLTDLRTFIAGLLDSGGTP